MRHCVQIYFWVAISKLAKNEVRRRLDKNLHRFLPWTQGQINDLRFPEPESSDLSARASPPKFLIPTLRKPRRVGQPQLGGAKGGPARPARKRKRADRARAWPFDFAQGKHSAVPHCGSN